MSRESAEGECGDRFPPSDCFSDTNEKLKEANQKLEVQFLQQKQQLEELNEQLKFYSRVSR